MNTFKHSIGGYDTEASYLRSYHTYQLIINRVIYDIRRPMTHVDEGEPIIGWRVYDAWHMDTILVNHKQSHR
jgi:hypothetical protein